MGTWAAIAKAAVQPTVAVQDLRSTENLRVLVVDANAIIGGVKLDGIADRAITVHEVLEEIRDKQSRQFLSSLPFTIDVAEPTEESIAAVTRFARETGDAQALSTTDMKILALAHTLEVAAHGLQHLKEHPNQPRLMSGKHAASSQQLPGWGSVPNPEDWKVVDEADDAAGVGSSRIATQAQSLLADSTSQQQQEAAPAGTSGGRGGAAAPDSSHSQIQAAVQAALKQQQAGAAPGSTAAQQDASAAQAAAPAPDQQQQEAAAAGDGQPQEQQAGDGDGWERVASSKTAARRHKKKAARRQAWQQAFESEWADHAEAMQQPQEQPGSQEPAAAASTGDKQQQQQQQEEEEGGSDSASEGGAQEGDSSGEDSMEYELLEDVVETTETESVAAGSVSAAGAAAGPPSTVATITQDFAMQNVLLQMGLRLLTREGQQVTRLRRWALRCPACFAVTKEAGRLFCPKCGNLGLDRVEVRVGPDGAEVYGINKRHVLRGTKYSLPKPRGGRNPKDPVLREDIFLLKVKALGNRGAGAKVKKPAAGEGAEADPFAPDYGMETWNRSQQQLAQHRGLAKMLQPAWKANPNEKRGPRKC